MATIKPQGSAFSKTDISKEIEDAKRLGLQLNTQVDDLTDRISTLGPRIGKVFQSVVSDATAINNSLKRTTELISNSGDSWKNYAKLQSHALDIGNQINTAEKLKASLIEKTANADTNAYKIKLEELKTLEAYSEKIRQDTANATSIKNGNASNAKKNKADKDLKSLNEQSIVNIGAKVALEEELVALTAEQSDLVKIELLGTEIEIGLEAKKQVDTIIEQNKKLVERQHILSTLKGYIGDAAKSLLPALSLGAILKSTVDYYFKIDTYSTNFAKNSGLSKGFAENISESYRNTSINLNKLNSSLDTALLTIKAQSEAQSELQEGSGQLSLYTAKDVQDQIYLTNQLGLKGDEAARINQLGLINNTTTEAATDSIFEQVAAANSLNGIRLSGKSILKEVAKVEGVIAANYNNNPVQLAKAVSQARALGVSLQEASQASRSLLDFESSIEGELEAELLTGKSWNLEKARALALSGDTAGALREELKNVGSLAEFQQQNVLAKEAEAKAIGMTVDQLADALRMQQVLSTSTKETSLAYKQILSSIKGSSNEARYMAELNSVTNGTDLKSKEDIVSKQIEMEESMQRVGDALKSIASGPVGWMVEGFAKMLSTATGLKTAVAISAGYMGLMATRSIITALAAEGSAFALSNWPGAIAAGVAIAAAIAAESSLPSGPVTSVNDALINPSGQIMISTGEGKMIKPSPRDSVLVAPNVGDAIGGGSPQTGNSRIENLLTAILGSVSKPGSVMLDSYRVGTVMGQSYSSYA